MDGSTVEEKVKKLYEDKTERRFTMVSNLFNKIFHFSKWKGRKKRSYRINDKKLIKNTRFFVIWTIS